jgi:hypothetical protein
MVLDNINESSSLAASLSAVVELLEGQIDSVVANGVRWGPGLHWLPPCRISQSWKSSWSFSGHGAMRT